MADLALKGGHLHLLMLFEMTGDYKMILPVVSPDDDGHWPGVISRRDILGAHDKAILKRALFPKA